MSEANHHAPMPTASNASRYSAVAIGLHWAIALLLFGNIFLAWNMHTADNRPIEDLFQLHKSIGISVLFLSFIRIAWRLMNPPPPLPEDMPKLEKLASHLVHMGFYGAMILLPITGWILVSASKFNVSTVLFGVISWPHLPILPELSTDAKSALHEPVEFVHSKLAWVVIVLAGLHVAGALKHQFSAEEGVLKKMIPGVFGKTSPPARTRGAWLAFGSALLVFVLIATIPLAGRTSASPAPELPSTTEVNSGWVVDQANSYIRFAGIYDGGPFEGEVKTWNATIDFDADNLAESSANVSIDTGSAKTSSKLYNDTLRTAEWFHVAEFPVAKVTVDGFSETETGYVANVTLTLKDITITVPLAFQLSEQDDGSTMMTGSTKLDRSALDLGMESDPTGDWVDMTVDINVQVTATHSE